ncbi:MAG: glycosyltransferase family 4 protein [Zetaproteobacteria bacterium]|nr:MAG: glycosyltransferase family 4 protein [Zetaproteobacteria bacterium]
MGLSLVAFSEHLLFASVLTVIAALVTRYMWRHGGILDVPNARSSHTTPTPRGGGVAIVVTFVIGVIAIFLFADKAHIDHRYFWAFLVSCAMIALISFYDDLKGYGFKIKLLTHVIAVAIALAGGLVIDVFDMPWIGPVELGLWGYGLTFLWLLGLTNAYNFMDGIDGLAASTAVIVSTFFAFFSLSQGSLFIYIVSYTLLAGSLGFLWWNRPPARIFMGDVGSAFLGFVFAAMAVIAARYDVSHTSFLVMPLLLFHFIFDTAFTMARRALAGEHIAMAHRTHVYQLLVRMGFSHGQVSVWYGLCAVLQGLAAMWMVHAKGTAGLWVFLPFVGAYAGVALLVCRAAKRRGLL